MSQDQTSSPEAGTNRLPFLLEIGSEEIPARFIPAAIADFERLFRAELKQAHLAADGIRVLATPRRMVLLAEGLAVRQPTPAALGFAKKTGLALADCGRGQDKRGEFLVAKVTETGRGAAEVLAEIVPRVILGIPFRKSMRWGEHEVEYPRPLQWVLMLLGEDVVSVKVDYLESGNVTRGHRTLSNDRSVEITHPDMYIGALAEVGVIVDHQERRRLISEGLQRELADFDASARLLEDDELLTEVVFLCEHPTPFLGTFSAEYLDLPAKVITTALKAHQRYFSVGQADAEGLLPRFAAVRDGGEDHLENVVRGNERVLHARLADAHFYWDFDQKKTPDERIEMLGAVTWVEGFGTVLDKTSRMESLVVWLWENDMGDGGPVSADLVRAAHIAKSDLVSEMIKDGKEFTKLEGFIGAQYAALAGENEQVCRSIERHYYPRSATGELPADHHAAVLAVADRLDNIAGCWLAGFVPTGAKDPYALRRHTLAVLRILLDGQWHVDLESALGFAFAGVAGFGSDKDLASAQSAAGEFVKTRIGGYLTDNLKVNAEVVRAVLPVRWRDPVDALAWVQALDGYREQADFQLLATGFKRCRNILKGDILPVAGLDACRERWLAGGQGVGGENLSALPERLEQELFSQVAGAVSGLVAAERSQNYHKVFALLSQLGPAIDAFFDGVRVNAEKEDLRLLRHAFLREIHGLFAQYADFAAVAAGES